MKRTISAMRGKGSLTHNRRDFIAENVDSSRTPLNIEYRNEDIRAVYHELFDDALARYNEKQTRRDRVIDDYYEKIRTGKQEKPFEELIIQIGNKDDMNASSENGQLARQMLDEYMQSFQQRNPTLRVFSAHLHMDEATPHLHIDFIPFTTGSKRGLETRVSLKKALEALGFTGGTKSHTELNQWIESEKQALCGALSAFPLVVTGTQGFANAQVTRGGVSLADVDPSTMASRLFDGLHIIGELLDVDGPCGGYNLHFAFAGALAAAKAIAG